MVRCEYFNMCLYDLECSGEAAYFTFLTCRTNLTLGSWSKATVSCQAAVLLTSF